MVLSPFLCPGHNQYVDDSGAERHSQRREHHSAAGLWCVPDQARGHRRAVKTTLDIGYRHIDTAEMYGNENAVGEGIRASGIAREEIFVTSTLNNSFHEPDAGRKAFDPTLSDLRFDYVG